jgi:hypothetical protein
MKAELQSFNDLAAVTTQQFDDHEAPQRFGIPVSTSAAASEEHAARCGIGGRATPVPEPESAVAAPEPPVAL